MNFVSKDYGIDLLDQAEILQYGFLRHTVRFLLDLINQSNKY